MEQAVAQELKCYHCGQPCTEDILTAEEKTFCCFGCKTVYEILSENDLCEYYALDKNPGVSFTPVPSDAYLYLDDAAVRRKIIQFDSPDFARINFTLPAIHCSSCIWLMENLNRLREGVLKSEVNFGRKSVTIDFDPAKIKLSVLAHLAASLGYPPQINLNEETTIPNPAIKSLVIKLAVAGFAFGNIMLFSFPEYLGLAEEDANLKIIFSYLNIVLAIPVLFYSGKDYLSNAWRSFRQRQINIDVPIAAGLLALFFRSAYDILSHTGPGYLDSLAGLVFFLLIGRWFQSKTYDSLAFDRDYKSYFPLAVYRWTTQEWKPVIIYDIKKSDRLRIRNMEVIPADSILKSKDAYIDYSFVTGEAKPVVIKEGELIYAGGRLVGQPIEVIVTKETSQSHLTSLWNSKSFKKPLESQYRKIIDKAATKFTWIVLGLAVITGVVWYVNDPSKMWLVLTAVLMVACPCALALVAPFTYGNMLRVFGRHGLYLKNADVIERMASIDSIVFDKTGTITSGSDAVKFIGDISNQELAWVRQLASCSTHPLSVLIAKSIEPKAEAEVSSFFEKAGKGLEGVVAGKKIKLGSPSFVGFDGLLKGQSSFVFVAINDQVLGYFKIESRLREEIGGLVNRLGRKVKAMLSGDQDFDHERMARLFHSNTTLRFQQTPHDKLDFVSNLQMNGYKVMMIGDGLNDSGALQQSDVGIVVTDDTGIFSPACDGIITGDQLGNLDRFIQLSKTATNILKWGFVISFFYNCIALSVAMTGHLTPLVAAILMPISSVSVVLFSTIAVNYAAKRANLSIRNL